MSFVSERKRIGFSQRAVATRMGVDQSAVCLWETGKTRPRTSLLVRLAALYGCTVDELLREDEPVTGEEAT